MLHLISFSSLNDPRISYWEENGREVGSKTLEGELKIDFSKEAYCTGYNDGKERHRCEKLADGIVQCRECKSKDISKVYTRLDFTGFEHMIDEFMAKEYAVYLAYFGNDLLKCGVTRKERVEKRLREQGADYWVELMNFSNAQEAYEMERLIQDHFGLRNMVTSEKKLEAFGKYDLDRVKQMVEGIRTAEPFCDYVLAKTDLKKNDFSAPAKFSVSENRIEGKITATKGEFVFFERDARYFALNMRKQSGKFFKL